MNRYSLKRQDCLLHFLHIVETELSEYSEDHQWSAPKTGFLKEWAAAAFRYERVKQMLDEIYHHHGGFENIMKIYVGTLGGWSCGRTKTESLRSYVEYVHFDVMFTNNMYSELDDKVMLNITDDVAMNWLMNGYYDESATDVTMMEKARKSGLMWIQSTISESWNGSKNKKLRMTRRVFYVKQMYINGKFDKGSRNTIYTGR